MANVFATRTGVWSATATWNTSALPTTVDDVYSNNFIVYVDNTYRVNSVRNTSAAGINAGGYFVLNDSVSLSAFTVGGGATGVYCVQFLSAAPASCTLVGNLCADNTAMIYPCAFINNSTGTATVIGNFVPSRNNASNTSNGFIRNNSSGTLNLFGNYYGALTNGIRGVYNASSGTINLVGTLSALWTNTTSNGLDNASTGTVNITGACGTIGTAHGVSNISTGTITMIGSAYGGTGSAGYGINNASTGTIIFGGIAYGGIASGAHGIYNASNGFVYISGNVIGGVGSGAYGAVNNATGYMYVDGIAIGNNWGLGSSGIGGSSPGIFGSQTGTTIIRGLSCGARGQWPTAGNVFIIPQNTSTATLETSAFQDIVLFTSLSTNIVPPASSVRQGTKYNLNDYTGTCIIPSISSVLQGVAVDNSIGIAALQPQTIWNYSVLSATDVDSLGGRLKDVATVQSVGQQLTALN